MDAHQEADASLREVLSAYPTGVTIVAGRDANGEPYGLTVNSFASVSLDPPLILVCIGYESSSHARLMTAAAFTINVLSNDQLELALRFSGEPAGARFDDVSWTSGASGAPILAGVAAWLECSAHERLEAGDHSIVLGRVERSAVTQRDALLFHRGRFGAARG